MTDIDKSALDAARAIETLLAENHIGGPSQRLAKIQIVVASVVAERDATILSLRLKLEGLEKGKKCADAMAALYGHFFGNSDETDANFIGAFETEILRYLQSQRSPVLPKDLENGEKT